MLALLALWLPMAWAFAQHTINIAEMRNGQVAANKLVASDGEKVTLTVTARQGFSLEDGSLLVEKIAAPDEGDHASFAPRRTPEVGGFVSLTQIGADTYEFVMPSRSVRVNARFCAASDTIYISEGTTTIESGTFLGQTNVTDIYLPDTDEPIKIELGAFTLDYETGDGHHIPTIHVPLHLLDDYALMTALGENYQAGKVQATAKVPRQYWSFSCGVDVALPEGGRLYIVRGGSTSQVEIVEVENAKVIKANNGVLLACPDDNGNTYEMVAWPSANRPSGIHLSTGNAHNYEGNLLEPVIIGKHYEAGSGYYILARNQFHRIVHEGVSAKVPPCKAVLRLQNNMTTRSLSIPNP